MYYKHSDIPNLLANFMVLIVVIHMSSDYFSVKSNSMIDVNKVGK